MLEIFAQTISTVDSSQVKDWHPMVFMGVAILVILGTVLPAVLAVVCLVLKTQAKSHQEQLSAQSEVHKATVTGLMEHQKEQIVRICDSHTRSFERSLDTFEKSMAKRDTEHAAIMSELRVINDKIDDVKSDLAEHKKEVCVT